MTDPRSDDRLRALLRTGDPAADGREPTDEERARLRRRVLSQVPERGRSWRWLPVATAVAALLVAVVLLTGPGATDRGTDLAVPVRPDVGPEASADAAPSDQRQQIQFATQNGTRIIWVLDPDLKL